jgi:hypothetical protein
LNLEKILASGCRQKILKALSKERSTNIMRLVRCINSTYIEVNRNITILKKEDILIEQYIGRLRILKLNQENPKTILLLQVLKTLEQQFDEPNLRTLKLNVK